MPLSGAPWPWRPRGPAGCWSRPPTHWPWCSAGCLMGPSHSLLSLLFTDLWSEHILIVPGDTRPLHAALTITPRKVVPLLLWPVPSVLADSCWDIVTLGQPGRLLIRSSLMRMLWWPDHFEIFILTMLCWSRCHICVDIWSPLPAVYYISIWHCDMSQQTLTLLPCGQLAPSHVTLDPRLGATLFVFSPWQFLPRCLDDSDVTTTQRLAWNITVWTRSGLILDATKLTKLTWMTRWICFIVTAPDKAFVVSVSSVGNNTVEAGDQVGWCIDVSVLVMMLSCCNIVSCTPQHYTRDTNPHASQLQAPGPREGSGQLPRNSGNILLRPPVSALG